MTIANLRFSGKSLGCRQARPDQQEQHDRQLEGEAERKNQPHDQRQIFGYPRLDLDGERAFGSGHLETDEEVPGKRRDNVIDHRCAHREQHRCRDQKGQEGLLFVLVERRRDEFPDLDAQDRKGNAKRGKEADL